MASMGTTPILVTVQQLKIQWKVICSCWCGLIFGIPPRDKVFLQGVGDGRGRSAHCAGDFRFAPLSTPVRQDLHVLSNG